MANVFKSKEVYKHVPGINSGDKLYAVRGMYVSGEHKVPYYIDGHVHLKSIDTSKAKIVNFTTESCDLSSDNVVNLISAKTSDIEIVNYSKSSESLNNDQMINLIGVNVSDIDIVSYSSRNENIKSDPMINLILVKVSDLDFIFYDNKKIKTLPDHTVRIKEITTTKAVVSNNNV